MASKAMYLTVTFLLAAVVTNSLGMVVISAGDLPTPPNECAIGPEHWCKNIATAKACHATKHCIQTVWERQAIPEDHDSICDICKEMVQEARDQLQSNETQEELKEVFEGSCNLMPIKMVRMNCIKMVDEFIPELIEMLSSQMNPTMVCTTALLCNNAMSDTLQSEYKAARQATSSSSSDSSNSKCGTCQTFMSRNSDKVHAASVSQVQEVLFNMCDRTNSYSDGCKAIVADNMDNIYQYLSSSVRTEACQPLGFCEQPSEKAPIRVSVVPKSNDRKWRAKFDTTSTYNDDMECEFCQTLVKNVRNILVSNTTESEFIQVLNGLCKQTGSYAQECQSLVAQYADVIYAFLMEELDPVQACQLLTLCPYKTGLKSISSKSSPFYLRLEPSDVMKATKLMPAKRIDNHRREEPISNDILVGMDEANALNSQIKASDFVLPAQLLVPASPLAPKKPTCILCEYVLHQLVEDLHNTTVQEEIETALKNVCKKLPSSVEDECDKLIDAYGDALFYLLSQELDPSTMCVQLELCTAGGALEINVMPADPFKSETDDPNTCALCEFVMSTLDKRLENNKTEESIKQAMENVCNHMPTTVRKDCTRLVDAYAKQIIEALLADLTPDEVCAALKFCTPKVEGKSSSESTGITLEQFLKKVKEEESKPSAGTLGEFMSRMNNAGKTNKVKQWTSPSVASSTQKNTPTCVMCEFAMSALEKQFITNKTTEEMKRMVDFVCAHLPTTVADMCIDFVEQYGDSIFQLLLSEVAPKAICTQMGLCLPIDSVEVVPVVMPAVSSGRLLGHKGEQLEQDLVMVGMPGKCEICETIVEYLDKLLMDDTIEESIDHIIERVCLVVPHGARDKCTEMVDTYGPYLLAQLGELMNKTKTCQSLHLCKPPSGHVQLLGGKQCTWGPTYWCTSLEHADACNAVSHCQTKVWMKTEP